MVKTVNVSRKILPVLCLVAIFLFVSPVVLAQGIGDSTTYTMQEEYRIEINDVGDGKITDTITYDEAWFEEYGSLFEENPNLLSRRYREDSDVGEVENFEADIDRGDGTITITFDTPGLAYNMGDNWSVYGYGNYEVADESDDEVVLEAAWEGVNNEFTLFENMNLEEQVIIDLPDGSTNASFDTSTGAIEYELAYVAKEGSGGVLADNKTLFTIIFALVIILSLILLLYVFTRETEAPAAVAAVTTAMPAPAAPQAPPEAAGAAQATAGDATAEAAPRFCKKCGHPKGKPDERFCRNCGATHE